MLKNGISVFFTSLTVSLILTVVIVSGIAIGFNYFYSSVKARAQLEEKVDKYMKIG